jgi:hypothetical protein
VKLANAAAYFDKTPCQDAFNPSAAVFMGQLDLFDDSRRDGATVARRILSVKSGTLLPARRVLSIHGEPWIVGAHQPDSFSGAVIRDKYVIHRGEACTIKTVAQALSTGGTDTYGARVWIKDFKEQEQSSKLESFYSVFLPVGETVAAGQILQMAGRPHLVRNVVMSAAGFLAAESDELASDAIVAGTYRALALNPVTDTVTPTDTAATFLRMRWQDDYAYLTEASDKYTAGDLAAYVAKATIATARAGDRALLDSVLWQILSVADAGAAWHLHLRRAGT